MYFTNSCRSSCQWFLILANPYLVSFIHLNPLQCLVQLCSHFYLTVMGWSQWPAMACHAHLQWTYELVTIPLCDYHKIYMRKMAFIWFWESFKHVHKSLWCIVMANFGRVFAWYCASILRWLHDIMWCFEVVFEMEGEWHWCILQWLCIMLQDACTSLAWYHRAHTNF